MSETRDEILKQLERLELPGGGTLVSRDMVRALSVENGQVRFVIEAPSPDLARQMEPLRAAAERAALSVPGVQAASVALTAHTPEAKGPPGGGAPGPRIGGHPTGGQESVRPEGVRSILAVASGKGASASRRSRRTLPSRWRGRGGGSGCWMQIFTVPACRA